MSSCPTIKPLSPDSSIIRDDAYGNSTYRTDGGGSWGWMWFDLTRPNLPYREPYRYDIFAGDSTGNGINKTIAIRREASSTNLDSTIKSAGALTLNTNNFYNQNSQILASGNATIRFANFTNESTAINTTINDQCVAQNSGTCYRRALNSDGIFTTIEIWGQYTN